MDFSKIPLFAAMTRRMDWLNQRTTVLAQNVANANTPGFRPMDLKAPDFRQELAARQGRLTPGATHAAHLAGTRPAASHRAIPDRAATDIVPSGNAVDMEQQLTKVAETQMGYQLMTNLYKKHLDMFRTALGRGQ